MNSIHKTAFVDKSVVLGDHVTIDTGTVIVGNVSIDDYTTIGCNCVIGKPGFGFIRTPSGIVRVPQIGGVKIGSWVFIGDYTCIDCATLEDTVIESFCDIGSYVTIGHNVRIGKAVGVGSKTGICGSTVIGKKVHIGSNCGIDGHLHIPDYTYFGDFSGITKDMERSSYQGCLPCVLQPEFRQIQRALLQLPDLEERIERLKMRLPK